MGLYTCTSTLSSSHFSYHFHGLQSIHEPANVVYNFPRVVVGYKGGVACTDAVTAIDQDHWYNGTVPLWLYPVCVCMGGGGGEGLKVLMENKFQEV